MSAIPNVVAACMLHNFILQMEYNEDVSMQTGEDDDAELREAEQHVLNQQCNTEPAASCQTR